MDINEQLHRQHEQFRNECFQRELQENSIKASSLQNQLTNARLSEINETLQKQIDETKREAEQAKKDARKSSIRAWVSIGIAIACGILEVISLILKLRGIL